MKLNKIIILSLFLVLICFIGAASASENVTDDIGAVSNDFAVDEVVSEVDSDDGSNGALNDEDLVSVDDSCNESLAVQDEEQVNDVEEVDSTLTAEDDNGQTPDILTDFESHDVIYVNISSDKDSMNDDVHGQSWDDAYGGQYAMYVALMCINENGIIYVANGDYTHEDFGGEITVNSGNFTIIGQGPKTNITNIISTVYSSGNENATHNFINLTFTGKEFGFNSNFINCTFLGPISISKDLLNYETRHIEEYGYAKTYFMNFDNCVFKDVTTDGSLVTLYKYGAVNFNNCTFENIVADSIVYHNDSSYFEEDGITLKECTFKNSKFNGVADSLANFDDAIVIEDCNYEGDVALGTTEVNGHFYVNATKLKVVAVDTSIGVSSPEKGVVVISLKDNDNKTVVGAKVTYKVNGEDKENVTDANGEIRIALTVKVK